MEDLAENIFTIIRKGDKKYDKFVKKYIEENKLSIKKKKALKDSKFIKSFAGFLYAITCLDYVERKTSTLTEKSKKNIRNIFKKKYNIDFTDFVNNYEKKVSKIVSMNSSLFKKLEKEKTYYSENVKGSALLGCYITDYEHIITVIKEDKQKREEYFDLVVETLEDQKDFFKCLLRLSER
jgi:hypothetical protein